MPTGWKDVPDVDYENFQEHKSEKRHSARAGRALSSNDHLAKRRRTEN